ncbi:MAG: family 10 glycosylhydrolase [Blastochloris sp.]|nr:family 10 glycosylhydrolase [Blastochloris sp.]
MKGRKLLFPDERTYEAYRAGGGSLSKGDWRRDNVNRMVRGLHEMIRQEKPWVKFGVSPFGIWRPGVPEGTMAYVDAYDHLYADSRKWMQEGWLDYCAPQLYWSRDSKEQPYEPLLNWWVEQNTRQRHLWPGIAVDRVGARRRPDEMVAQIMLSRIRQQTAGNIHWNMKPLLRDQLGVGTLIRRKLYEEPALVPESPWMRPAGLGEIQFKVLPVTSEPGAARVLRWELGEGVTPLQGWVLRQKRGEAWLTTLLPRESRSFELGAEHASELSLAAVDRYGRLGPEQAVMIQKPSAELSR